MTNGKVITVMIRKGGSAKTTTSTNLASGLAKQGKKTLLIDLDSQSNCSIALGKPDGDNNLAKALKGEIGLVEAIQQLKDFDLLASTTELADIEPTLTASFNLSAINQVVSPLKAYYDYIVIDTPPNDGIMTRNALVASDGVIIPTQAQTLAVKGVVQALELIRSTRQFNPKLTLIGILPTMVQTNTNMSGLFMDDLRRTYGDALLEPIPLTIRITESQLAGEPVIDYAPNHPASKAYLDLSKAVIKKMEA